MLPTATSPPPIASSSSPTRPVHEQYTRNMATGASTADVAIILVDAAQRHPDPVAPSRLHRLAAGHPPHRRRGQQDGPGGLFSRGLCRRWSATCSSSHPSWASTDCTASPSARCTATTWSIGARGCTGMKARRCSNTWRPCPRGRMSPDAALPPADPARDPS